jgi:dolichol-phosphate mannosyltransferase
MTPPTVTVVVPTLDERDNVEPLARRIFASNPADHSELLFVDDDSRDGTAEAVRSLAHEFPVRCIVRREARGLATAAIRGMREALGDLVVVMDADLSHPPERIPALLAALTDPAVQMALGSRKVEGGAVGAEWPWTRRLTSAVAAGLARPLTGVADITSGFFCVRRADVEFERLRPVGYKIALELIVRHGWTNVVEIPITFRDRTAGESKLDLREQLRYLRHLARLYRFGLFSSSWK